MTAKGIDYFGRGHWLTNVQVELSLRARRRMFELWRAYSGPTPHQKVLDIGATPDLERADSNCMIPWFLEEGLSVSLYSTEDISELRDAFPTAKLLPRRGPRDPIPSEKASYDWVAASAVVEHVGRSEDQMSFLRECGRVANGVFVTTPNRGHWLEFHTKLPLLHWLPKAWHRALLRAMGKTVWAEESHLNLLSKAGFEKIAARAIGGEFDFEVKTVWSLGMPSNLVLLARRRNGDRRS